MFLIDRLILLAAVLLLAGIVSSKFSARLGLPVLVLFLGIGMLAGEDGIGGIQFDNVDIAHAIGTQGKMQGIGQWRHEHIAASRTRYDKEHDIEDQPSFGKPEHERKGREDDRDCSFQADPCDQHVLADTETKPGEQRHHRSRTGNLVLERDRIVVLRVA